MKFTVLLLTAATAIVAQDTVTPSGSSCEPHGDHWHCPDGVPEPTTPPPAEAVTTTPPAASTTHSHDEEEHDDDHETTGSGTTCEPHGDHWHCPSGVAEPTTAPAASTTGGSDAATTSASTPTSSAAPAEQTANAAAVVGVKGGVLAAVLGAVAFA